MQNEEVVFASVVAPNHGVPGQSNYDQEFERLKKQYPKKLIGLNISNGEFNGINFSKFYIVNINNRDNRGNYSFRECTFKNLEAKNQIIHVITFTNCKFLEGTKLKFDNIKRVSNSSYIGINFSESNEVFNGKNQEIELELSSIYNVEININKLN